MASGRSLLQNKLFSDQIELSPKSRYHNLTIIHKIIIILKKKNQQQHNGGLWRSGWEDNIFFGQIFVLLYQIVYIISNDLKF